VRGAGELAVYFGGGEMKMQRLFLCVSLLAVLEACSSTRSPVVAKPIENQGLDVKTGVWQIVITHNEKESAIPQEVLETLSPEMRATFEKRDREFLAKYGHVQPLTLRFCVAPDDLRKGFTYATERSPNNDCKYVVTRSSAQQEEMNVTCKDGNGRDSTRYFRSEATSRESVKSKMVLPNKLSKTVVDSDAKWIGDNCPENLRLTDERIE
jgi:hypothetical protein